MIYLWIGQGSILWHQLSREKLRPKEPEEDVGNQILDELTAKGFIEPVYQKCSFVLDSCRMSHFVRSSLANEAKVNGFILDNGLDMDTGFVDDGLCGHTCVVNVGEAIIDGAPQTFEKMKHVYSLYLGRWQNLSTHHIEVVDAKILRQPKKLKNLKFLSLRGISMITELSSFISKLNDMKILDLKACHNLELIPNNISLLKNLTHINMSECYFLEYMPKGIAELSNLEVLKGFIVRDYNYKKEQCTLQDLSRLRNMRKLNIYTNSECFPSQKDLQGGKLRDIHQFHDRPALDRWNVNILRLKFLRELKINWSELRFLFPKCNKKNAPCSPTSRVMKMVFGWTRRTVTFCCSNSISRRPIASAQILWMDEKDIDILLQQQHFKKATSISSNSTSGSGPSAAQNDCNICPIDVIVEE
ncbi:hypothetical protein Vadar_030538 [Vaccinium darrowii]|uniref:Uncharacterized protein n=1 Tax=Vaccinium darrowii TaxID=229202 RepID=A0ACB7XDC3_9ERIC|nr:hypothetical protein Vadar_030538 [Vaccinium darrowii]